MSWTLSAAGRVTAGMEHLEQELHDELHKVLSDPRFGLLFSHLQGLTVDRMHTVGQAPAEPEPEPAAEAGADSGAAGQEGTAAADEAGAESPAKSGKAAKTAPGGG